MGDGRDTPLGAARGARAPLHLLLFPALFGPAQLPLLGPHTTYSRNASEYAVGFWTLAGWWLWALVPAVAVLVAAGLWLPRRWQQRYVAVLFGLGALLWIQGNLLVPDFGPLYGAALDIDGTGARALLEAGLWGVALLLAIRYARHLSTAAPLASGVLLGLHFAVLAASASGLVGTSADEEPRARVEPSASRYFQPLAQHEHHSHCAGRFQSEVFAQAMGRLRADFDRDFSGFVFFADHLGAFRSTRGSMPAMFSGVPYRNDVPFDRFRAGLAKGPSIFTTVASRGYRIHSVTFHPGEHPPASMRRGVVRYFLPTPFASRETYERFAAAEVLDLTLFRHAPHALKRWIYNDDAWLLQRWSGSQARQVRQSNHVLFLDEFTQRMAAPFEQPVYLYMHVIPPHPPIVLDEACGFVGRQPLDWTTFSGQAECVLARVRRLLDGLRRLGVYDRSVILLTADHGWGLERPDDRLKRIQTPAGPLDRVAAGAMPLLAIKPAGASDPVKTSYAPTSLMDIPATVAAMAGADADALPGRSVFEIDESAVRSRTYAFHDWSDANWTRPYYDALLLFDVSGRVTDARAWTFRRAILDPTADAAAVLRDLEMGLSAELDLGDGPFRSGGPYAVTYAPPDARAVTVTARRNPAARFPQRLTVRVDGRVLGRVDLAGAEWRTWTHPLQPREGGRSPFCIELLVERSGGGSTEPVPPLQYRTPFWTR